MNINPAYKIAKINKDAIELLLVNKNFQAEIIKIRSDFGIDLKNLTNDGAEKWLDRAVDDRTIAYFLSEVDRILKKFKLANNFKQSIINYVFNGEYISVPASNYAIDFSSDNINVIIYQKPTQGEWREIKKSVADFIEKSKNKKHFFLEKFNYPNGAKPLRPKPKLSRNLGVLGDIKNNVSYKSIEAERFDEGDDFITTAKSKKNIGNIKVIKNRYKKKGYI